MSKQVVTAVTKIGLLSVMAMIVACGSAQGQSLGYKLRANIPFDFEVAGKKLPAGEYFIGRAQSSGDTILAVRSVDRPANAFPVTNAVQTLSPKNNGTLVFHRYGDEYFLFQVWAAGANTGRVIPKSHREREIERNARGSSGRVAKKEAVETVSIAGTLY